MAGTHVVVLNSVQAATDLLGAVVSRDYYFYTDWHYN